MLSLLLAQCGEVSEDDNDEGSEFTQTKDDLIPDVITTGSECRFLETENDCQSGNLKITNDSSQTVVVSNNNQFSRALATIEAGGSCLLDISGFSSNPTTLYATQYELACESLVSQDQYSNRPFYTTQSATWNLTNDMALINLTNQGSTPVALRLESDPETNIAFLSGFASGVGVSLPVGTFNLLVYELNETDNSYTQIQTTAVTVSTEETNSYNVGIATIQFSLINNYSDAIEVVYEGVTLINEACNCSTLESGETGQFTMVKDNGVESFQVQDSSTQTEVGAFEFEGTVFGVVSSSLQINEVGVSQDLDLPEITSFSFTSPNAIANKVYYNLSVADSSQWNKTYISLNSTRPSPIAEGWLSGTAATASTQTLDTDANGLQTVYVWIQDENGNVSNSASDQVYFSENGFFDSALQLAMIRMEAGTFSMGSAEEDDDSTPSESPQVDVTLSQDYFIASTEITVDQYKTCNSEDETLCPELEENTNFSDEGKDDHPITGLTIEQAEGFAAWLSDQNSRELRLCSEAEWEYAARAGTTTDYICGSEGSCLETYAQSVAVNSDVTETTAVASLLPNGNGLYDMFGNAAEWMLDQPYTYSEDNATDPVGTSTSTFNTLRGGSFATTEVEDLRSAKRLQQQQTTATETVGMRLCSPLFRTTISSVTLSDFNTLTINWGIVQFSSRYSLEIGVVETVGEDPIFDSPLTVNNNFYIHEDLTPGQTYYYRVTPVNEQFETVASAIATGIVPELEVEVSSADISKSGVTLSWAANANASAYEIHYAIGTSQTYSLRQTVTNTSVDIDDLLPDTLYKFKVVPRNDDQTGNIDNITALEVRTLAMQVTDLNVSSSNFNTVTLTWTLDTLATGYTILQKLGEEGEYENVAQVTSSPYQVTGLDAGATYFFKLNPFNDDSVGDSNEVEVNLLDLQLDEVELSDPTERTIEVDWNNLIDAAGYNIYLREESESEFTQLDVTTQNSYSVTGLLPGTTYQLRVEPFSGDFKGQAAISDTFKTKEYTVDDFITTLTANEITAISVTLRWEEVTKADKYVVKQSSSKTGPFTDLTETTSLEFQVLNLTQNTVYYFKVVPSNDFIEGSSNIVKVNTSELYINDLRGSSVDITTVELTWTENEFATTYKVYVSTVVNGTFNEINAAFVDDEITPPSEQITNLTPNTTYYFKVLPIDEETADDGTDDRSGDSTIVTVSTPSFVVNNLLAADVQERQLTLSWEANSNWPDHITVTHYNIYYTESGTTTKLGPIQSETTTATVTDLKAGTTYTFEVRPSTQGLEGDVEGGIEGQATTITEETLGFDVDEFIAVVSVVDEDNDITSTSVKLTWEEISKADYYQVQRSEAPDSGFVTLEGADALEALEYLDEGLSPLTTYYYKVLPYNNFLVGSSNTLEVTTELFTRNLTAVATSATQVNLSWNANDDADEYRVYQSTTEDSGYVQVGTATQEQTTFSLTGLEEGTTYYVQVRPFNDELQEGASKTLELPIDELAVSMDTIKAKNHKQISLVWNESAVATGYKIYRSTSEDSGFELINDVDETSYVDGEETALSKATQYYYQIVPYNELVTGYIASTSSVQTEDFIVENLIITSVGITEINFMWDVNEFASKYIIGLEMNGEDIPLTLSETTGNTRVITDLTPNTTYTAKVKPFGEDEEGTFVSIDVKTETFIVQNVSATQSETDPERSILITWDDLSDADNYIVYESVNGFGVSEYVVAEPTSNTLTRSELQPGQTYYYRVTPYSDEHGEGESDQGSQAEATTNVYDTDDFITELTVTTDDNINFQLEWNEVELATKYLVQWKYGETGEWLTDQTITDTKINYTVINNDNSGSAFLRVLPANDFAQGTSNIVPITISFFIIDDLAETETSASSISFDSVELQWSAIEGATGYQVFRGTSESNLEQVGETTTELTFEVTGLSPNITYFFEVKPYDDTETGTSNTFSTTTNSFVVSNLTAEALGETSAQLTWSRNDNWPDDVELLGYNFYQNFGEGIPTLIATLSQTFYFPEGLTAGTTHTFDVRPFTADYEGNSTTVAVTTDGWDIEDFKTTVTQASATSTSVTLQWELKEKATEYFVRQSDSEDGTYTTVGHIDNADTSTYTVTGLEPNTTYYFKIQSSNTYLKVSSDPLEVALSLRSDGLGATATSQTSVNLTWDENSFATGFKVNQAEAAEGPFSEVADVTTTSHTLEGLNSGTTYYVTVIPYNEETEGASDTLVLPAGQFSTTLTNVQALNSQQIQLTWEANAVATGYKVQRATSSEGPFSEVADGTTTTYTDDRLQAETQYFYQVIPYNSHFTGFATSTQSATTQTLAALDNFVSIAAATFTMGNPSPQAWEADESPTFSVTFSDAFYMAKTEVTAAEFKACVDDGGCTYDQEAASNSTYNNTGQENHPINYVSYLQAQAYITWFNTQNAGLNARLCTEAEFEYALRGGTSASYFCGSESSCLADYAWYSENSSDALHEVATKSANPYGLYDLNGNVGEWVQDEYATYPDAAQTDYVATESGTENADRSWRGGGYNSLADGMKSHSRDSYPASQQEDILGFRLCADGS